MELRGEDSFSDSIRWLDLSKELKVRLPLWKKPCSTGGFRRFLKKINISVEQYLADNNEKNLKEFINNNPDWPLRAWCGIQLENIVGSGWEPKPKLRPGRPKKVIKEIL